MKHDEWLAPFLSSLHAAHGPVLELGCGPGEDAARLTARGFSVIACDRAWEPLRKAHEAALTAALFQADLTAPFPVRSHSVGVVVASLSLHYFHWETTQAIAAEIHCVLRPHGVLLFRVNATDDVLHGAGMGEVIEPGLYKVPDQYGKASINGLKRYFDAETIRVILADGFTIAHLAHATTYRYTLAKQVWECLAISQ